MSFQGIYGRDRKLPLALTHDPSTLSVSSQLEGYIQKNLRLELAQVQQHLVQNQTATMLELGTSLLTHTTAQTRKLTSVEAQVLQGEGVALGAPWQARLAHSPSHLALTLVPGKARASSDLAAPDDPITELSPTRP